MDFTHLLSIIGGREDGEEGSLDMDPIERRRREEQEQEVFQLDIIYATELVYFFLFFMYFLVRIRAILAQPFQS